MTIEIKKGVVFGGWTVESPTENKKRWWCVCECGTRKTVLVSHLRNGTSQSCGCRKIAARTTHGMSRTPEYLAWKHMIGRCRNPQTKHYERYGGRGISVCEEWSDFAKFYADVGPRPSKDHSLDRLDNDGNYVPGNVAWRTKKEQGNNRANNVLVTYRDETLTAAEMGRKYGVSNTALLSRLKLNWPIEKALMTPVRPKRPKGFAKRYDKKRAAVNMTVSERLAEMASAEPFGLPGGSRADELRGDDDRDE
jgi:hypothetical protein